MNTRSQEQAEKAPPPGQQVLPLTKHKSTPRPVKVRSLRDAKRLLSRMITQLQAGTIQGQAAKDLCYLLSTFIQLVRDYELEARIKRIEDTIGKKT